MPNKIMLVRDLMHVGVMTCPADTSVVEATRILLDQNLESLLVLDENGHTAGVFGRHEAVKAYIDQENHSGDWQTLTVADVMHANILEVPPDIPATTAAQIMLDEDTRDIYLLHHAGGIGWPAAMFRFDEVLRYLGAESEAEVAAMGVGAPRKSGIEFFKDRYAKVT
jgi:CBS domain-containing protein